MRGLWLGCVLAVVACGGGDDDDDDDDVVAVDAADVADAGGTPDANACPRAARPANGPRFAVVSHPFDTDGNPSGVYEVLAMAASGELSRPGTTFEMGRSNLGTIEFTPDGEIGVVAQDDGTLGVFRIDDAGAVQVVHAGYSGAFYADAVVRGADGAHMYVIDPNWRKNGGGIYEITIGCDGTITGERMITAAKSAGALTLLPDGRAVLWSDDVLESAADKDAHLVDLAAPSVVGSVDAFADDDAIIGSAAVTGDGRFALGGDTSQFSGVDNRVAVVEITASGLTATHVLTPIEDPIAIATSPDGDTAIVASGFGDAVFVLDYAPAETPPFTLRGELAYTGGRPALPGKLVMIARGDLTGRVLLAENVGVRQIQFDGAGTVTDHGEFTFGSGLDNITGSIGIQP